MTIKECAIKVSELEAEIKKLKAIIENLEWEYKNK